MSNLDQREVVTAKTKLLVMVTLPAMLIGGYVFKEVAGMKYELTSVDDGMDIAHVEMQQDSSNPGESRNTIQNQNMLQFTSSAFEAGGNIPKKYTCDADNTNPPFTISGVPEKAVTLAIIMEDLDVPIEYKPDGIFDHWVVWNIPVSQSAIAVGEKLDATYGVNGAGKNTYIGPCPPNGEHRYFFNIYALDTKLDLPDGSNKDKLLSAMEGHIIEQTQLMGKYSRTK